MFFYNSKIFLSLPLFLNGLSIRGLLGLAILSATPGIATSTLVGVRMEEGPAGTLASSHPALYVSMTGAKEALTAGGALEIDALFYSRPEWYSDRSEGGQRFAAAPTPTVSTIGSQTIAATVAQLSPAITSATAGPMLRDGVTLPLDGRVVPLNVATFAFTASEPALFSCTLDGRSESCSSPVRYGHLAPGPHRFEVHATDRAGNRDPSPAVVNWTVGPVVGEVTAEPKPIQILGPKLLRAHDLLTRNVHPISERMRIERGDELENETSRYEPGGDDCSPIVCRPDAGGTGVPGAGNASAGAATAGAITPAPSFGPFNVGTTGNDPQIAASSTHLIVTNGTIIRFYTKAGTPLTTDKNGNPFTNPITPAQFFWYAWFNPKNPPTINDDLKLPTGLQCDPSIDIFATSLTTGQKAATADCMGSVYDTRVIFDDTRKRFWLVSSVRNNFAGAYLKLPTPQQRVGRRDRLLAAVSLTEDPRDGWYVYAWSGALDQGACNNIGASPGPPPLCPGTEYRPLEATDYPSIGISQYHFVTSIGVVNFNPWAPVDKWRDTGTGSYTSIQAFDAFGLANGGCTEVCGWSYGRFKAGVTTSSGKVLFSGDPFFSITQPAIQHGSAPEGSTVLASNLEGYDMAAVISFSAFESSFAPPLRVRFLPVQPTKGINEMPQRSSPPVTNPLPINVKNLGNGALKAAARNNKLYVTWMDCKKWTFSQSECSTSIRLVGVDLENILGSGSGSPIVFDNTFGRNSLRDPVDALVYYGNPATEVNKDNDVIVVYNRSGTGVFLEAAYSAFIHDESGSRPGAVLQAGNFPYGANAVSEGPTATLNLDTGGIAVDPKDGVGIWVAHAFAYKSGTAGQVNTAVGKVFGKLYYDLVPLAGVGIELSPGGPKRGKEFEIRGQVSNEGDSRSPAAAGTVYLREPKRSRIQLGKFLLPPLPSGESAHFHVSARWPAGLRAGEYEIEIVLPGDDGEEYSIENNVARRTVRVDR
jgi:hypothetical protein